MQTFRAKPSQWTDQELSWIAPFANAQILALGEAVHTSDGFYSAKVRLIKYLVEHHGYRAIAFETPWGRALRATEYVQNGSGSVQDALEGLFRVWRSTSVVALLDWLLNWNKKNPQDPVRFFGNDTQQPEWDLQFLLSSKLMDAEDKAKLKNLFVGMYGEAILQRGLAHLEARKIIRAKGFIDYQDNTSQIVELLKHLSFGRDTLEFIACKSLMADTLQFSKDVYGALKNDPELQGESFAHRDECMSDLTLHFAQSTKTILWAHNLHICRPSEKLTEGLFYQGQFLQKVLKENYKCIGLSAGRMDINWPWISNYSQGPQLSDSALETILTKANPGKSVFITSKENIEASSMSQDIPLGPHVDITDHFDGLLILPESPAIIYAVSVV